MSPISIEQFQKIIWDYYRRNRRDMPWRKTKDPYRIVVSEIMLQQTQVARVKKYYGPFVRQFPDFKSLARADARAVLRAWSGLGYNRRALSSRRLAVAVIEEYNGRLPRRRDLLEKLPGIGKATAGAVMAFAFNLPEPFIETNIRRVFIHFFFPNREKVSDAVIMKIVEKAMMPESVRKPSSVATRRDFRAKDAQPDEGMLGSISRRGGRFAAKKIDVLAGCGAFGQALNPREWYWALMDYGAMLGFRAVKTKVQNPNARSAHYKKQSKFSGSDRELRGKILRLLLSRKKVSIDFCVRELEQPRERLEKIIARLVREGFLLKKRGALNIPTC